MAGKIYFEDFKTGSVTDYGPRRVTRDEIIAFASEFDPQPMHLDEEAGRATLLGGLAASGWHACCLMMRMAVEGFVGNSSSIGAPGVDEVRWLKPLRPDTALTLRVAVLETRVSNSRPTMGFVKMRMELLDEAGEPIMMMLTPGMFGRRGGADS